MIDPSNITRYDETDIELQEKLLFWICAAGKNAMTSARGLDNFLTTARKEYKNKSQWPFVLIRWISLDNDRDRLALMLKQHGIGCYNQKAKTMLDLANSGLDLKTCTVEDLEQIKGIGPKTARCFVIHSREHARHAGLDTHILKFLRDMGYEVPVSTPTGKKYQILESLFLDIADSSGMTASAFDLVIWNIYSGKAGYPNKEDFVNQMKANFFKYKLSYPRSAA